MNGQNKNRKSIDDIINASDLAELLSDSLEGQKVIFRVKIDLEIISITL